jgi:hypothetical protein
MPAGKVIARPLAGVTGSMGTSATTRLPAGSSRTTAVAAGPAAANGPNRTAPSFPAEPPAEAPNVIGWRA